jgi:hypothetical protein
MTKRAKKRQPTQTPPEWADTFREHDHELTRIRMLWRRGGGRYRPIVPVNLALEDLEALDFEEWEELELDETHFEWSTPINETADERERRLAEAARELWAVAMAWTRAKGPVCDFQLRGYGSGDEIAFEDGKRCNLSGEHSRHDDSGQERATIDDTMRAMIGDERTAWHQMDRLKDAHITRLTTDSERLLANLERTTATAPRLIQDAREILEDAIEFQQKHFEDYVGRAGGQRELEAKAFAEYQKTKRFNGLFELLRDGGRAVVAAIPTALQLFEHITERDAPTLPKFEVAQQAIAYLHLSLQPERLAVCFAGDTSEARLKRARTAMTILMRTSKIDDELQALIEVGPLIQYLFRTERFQEVASAEERIAARYVLARAAMYRLAYEHEPED